MAQETTNGNGISRTTKISIGVIGIVAGLVLSGGGILYGVRASDMRDVRAADQKIADTLSDVSERAAVNETDIKANTNAIGANARALRDLGVHLNEEMHELKQSNIRQWQETARQSRMIERIAAKVGAKTDDE